MSAEPKLLFVRLPEIPAGASFTFHPFSRSQQPQRYKPVDLKDTGEARTTWLGFFEETLVGLYWKLAEPVPYVFRTVDGRVRSLDAGCLKWLLNRKPPELQVHLDQVGFIHAVTPRPELQTRYEERRIELVARLSAKPGPG